MRTAEEHHAEVLAAPGLEGSWRAALSGTLAAAVALGAGEVPSAVAGERVGPVTAIGNEFVDRYAASLKDVAVSLFGRNDKVALVTGIIVVSLAVGAGLGLVARRSLVAASAGFVAFGTVGFWAGATDPGGGLGVPVLSAIVGVAAGVGTLAALVRWAVPPTSPSETTRGPTDDPTVRAADRRTFLYASGAVGAAAALTGFGAWSVRNRSTIAAQRADLVLPEPTQRASIPGDGLVDIDGVSPYVTPNGDFYRIDTALITPQVDAETWRLRVTGRVDRPYELTFDELLAMDMVEEPVTIACVSNEVGGDLVGNATQVVGRATDGFTVGFPTDNALDGRVALVAVGMNGEPLPASHGYPARLVVAGLYGYVSATKWLTEIELTRLEDFDAYWIPRGWSKLAPVKTQSRIDVPRSGADVPAGTVAVGGVAWAPGIGITGVEVRVDDGPWEPAELGEAANDNTWVQWLHRWDADPGEHLLACRATDGAGNTQTAERSDPRPDGATGHHTVRVTVRS